VALVIAGFAALALLDGGNETEAADPCATVQTAAA
jgi:hypothetical protein